MTTFENRPTTTTTAPVAARDDMLIHRIEELERNLGVKLDDLKRGQRFIYQRIDQQDRELLETILGAVQQGRAEQDLMQRTLNTTHQALAQIQQYGLPVADPDVKQAMLDIQQSLNRSQELQQQVELTLPIIPMLLQYKVNLAAGVDLAALWDEWKQRIQKQLPS